MINDFRNFYKPDRKKTRTTMQTVVEKSLAVVGDSLITQGIRIETSYKSIQELEVHEHELMQVVLNILSNAKDNFIQREIQTPVIYIEVFQEKIIIKAL